MILHLIAYDKFTEDFIKRTNYLFDESEHLFFVFGKKSDDNIKSINANVNNVVYREKFTNRFSCGLFLLRKILVANKVIIHALFFSDLYLRLLLLLQPIAGNKYFWNIWGYDLYNAYWEREKTPKREKLRIRFIRKLKAVGYIPKDYEFLCKHYKTVAKFYLASYSYDFFTPETDVSEEDKQTINILLGNSATEECQYEKSIDILEKYLDKPIKVKCVLSYPKENQKYREKIIEYGHKKLGDRFIPLVGFMTYEKYMKLLSGIDIAIFNHNRQQALGNIASLLYLGKRVYINPENGCKDYFEHMGAKVFSTDNLTEADICKSDCIELKYLNRKAIDEFFSDEQFKKRWKKIFDNKY